MIEYIFGSILILLFLCMGICAIMLNNACNVLSANKDESKRD